MKKQFKFIATLFLTLAIAAGIATPAQSGTINVPPHTEFFYVNDFSAQGVIPDWLRNELVRIGDNLYTLTGAQVVLTVVDFLGGHDIEQFSVQMYNTYQIGRDGRGALILLAIHEAPGNRFIVQLGHDTRNRVTDAMVHNLMSREFDTFFDNGDYDHAMSYLFRGLNDLLGSIYANDIQQNLAAGGTLTSANEGGGWGAFWAVIITIVIIIFLFAFLSAIMRPRGPRMHGGMMMPRRRFGMGGGFMWGWMLGRS
ncbi:MAG: TPM domain-containing protein, partial [Defluviitaleaceae bacterium]|nr:TPM domain-containing protein [Defluviitaleaceae bacterium]